MTQPTNNVITLAAQTTAGNISFTDANGFAVDSVSATMDGFHPAIAGLTTNAGTVTLQSGGLVTQTQRILASAFSLQGSGPYQLTNGANALILGVSTVSGSFDVTTGGAITQSGAVTVIGTTTLAAGATTLRLIMRTTSSVPSQSPTGTTS